MKTNKNDEQPVVFSSTLEAVNEQFVRSRDYIKHLTRGAVQIHWILENRSMTSPENRKLDVITLSIVIPILSYYQQYAKQMKELKNTMTSIVENDYYMITPNNFRSRMLEKQHRIGDNISMEMGWAKELLEIMFEEFKYVYPDFDRTVQPPQ